MGKYSLEIKWGLVFTGASLLWMVFEKLVGWHGEQIEIHATMTNIFSIVAIGVFVVALRAKRQQLGGVMTWKQGFLSGVLISIIVMILAPLSQYITHYIISTDYFSNAIAHAMSTGQATEEEANAFFNFKNYMIMSTIGALVMGVFTSAVVALVLKTK